MMQRYIVFLNDRVVSIDQDINMPLSKIHGQTVYYTDKSALAEAYKRFYADSDCAFLRIIAAEKFTEACQAFNSFFTRIEAAGGIVRNQKQEYLFINRLGVWDLPKGKLHKKEAISDGALREVEEETGLTNLTLTKQITSTFHIYTDRKGREILKETYWFEMMCEGPQNPVPQLEEDITEVKWFSEATLDIPIKNTYASLRNLMESYLHSKSS
jgi:ADP-ribose pyrophosphatase YjhB (NUDIX family)